ncbi:hypothetical protein TNCV_2407931 [Trichonephila clavipes]|nr:hypothetical protein TNCV_2407931 [Trichonephila clavipes]
MEVIDDHHHIWSEPIKTHHLVLREDCAFEGNCSLDPRKNSIMTGLPYRRIRSAVVNDVWESFLLLATFPTHFLGCGIPLLTVGRKNS